MRNETENGNSMEEMPVKREMHLELKKTEPSGYPVSMLKDQLAKLGLACEETSYSQLQEYKEEIMKDFPKGERQAYCIVKGRPQSAPDLKALRAANRAGMNEMQLLERLGISAAQINGSWVIDDDAGGYRAELCTLIYEKNFDKLLEKHPDTFAGTKSSKEKVINEPTGSAIKDAFKTIAMAVCTTVKSGIAKEDLESIVSGIIGDNTSENPKDYEVDDVLSTYLVKGYDPETETANAVGVLAISYRIHIKDYKDKSDHKDGRYNDAQIKAVARFVSYSETETMDRDLGYLDQDNLADASWEDIPVPSKKIVVYTERPEATKEVFNTGVPVTEPGAHADSLIFFCPDFENVGYIDNKDSDVITTYSRSVGIGFSHSSEYSISSEVSMELDCSIVKFGVTMGVSMSVTEEWNQSQEETISFEVGAGKEAYLYQGKLKSIVLRYDPAEKSYRYLENSLNTFSTTSVKTLKKPIK